MDMDRVTDVRLYRNMCACCCGDVGTLRVYGTDQSMSKEQKEKGYYDVGWIPQSKRIFDAISEFLSRGAFPAFRLGSG